VPAASTRSCGFWVGLGCRTAPARTPARLLADPHLNAREMIVDVDYPPRGTYQTVGCPVKLSDSPVEVSRPPMLGEHTEALLQSLCGVDPAETRRLREDGVV